MALSILIIMHEILNELQDRHEILSAKTTQEKIRFSEDKPNDLQLFIPRQNRQDCASSAFNGQNAQD